MSGFVRLEKYQVLQRKDGCVYKTKKVGSEWFPIKAQPDTNKEDKDGFLWVVTLDYHFGPTKPSIG